jgi:small subunit ribosomal protein S20
LATHKSAEKRARQSVVRAARNKNALGAVRTFEKKIRTAIAAGDKTAVVDLLKVYTSKATRAAVKGVMPSKTASRKIGQLSGRVHAFIKG